jgi:hypothetical protein
MLESEQHVLTTVLGTYTFDRNADPAQPRAYVTDPSDDVSLDREVVRYPSQDFSYVGDGYDSARILTLVGVLEAATPELYMPERQLIRGLVNSIRRADGLLQWTPFGMDPVQMVVRRHERPEISAKPEVGGMVLSLIAGDPRIYSQALVETEIGPPSDVGGITSPMVEPLVETQTGDPETVTNAGDTDTFPIIEIHGPITSPRIRNTTTGLVVSLPGLIVANGDFIEVAMSPPAPTVRLNGSELASRYSYVDSSASDFWPLVPGENLVELFGVTYTAGVTKAVVKHRHAWMP